MPDIILNPYMGYFLLIFIIGFIAGWVVSNIAKPVLSKDGKKEDEKTAYLKGINFILTNETDKAIEEFIKAVRIDSNTIDTYFTLGNLFRTKGDIGRATRIHQSITLRPSIDEKTRLKALFELGLDFKRAGFIKRAITVFEEVIHKEPSRIEGYEQLEALYEETKDWEKAIDAQTKIQRVKKSKKRNVLAHLYVEMGKLFWERGEEGDAKRLYKKAISLDDACVDAYLHLGDLYASKGEHEKALRTWKKILDIAPRFAYLAYPRLEDSYFRLGQFDEMEGLLKSISVKNPGDCYTHLALARYLYKKQQVMEAIKELRVALEYNPEFIDARKELGKILIEEDLRGDVLEEFKRFLGQIPSPQRPFQCSKCGYEAETMMWKCPQCQRWDTVDIKETLQKKQHLEQ